jgi:hypothetical protein
MFISCNKFILPGTTINELNQTNPNNFYFYKNHTFKYEYHALGVYKYSSGRWTYKNKNSILLKSGIQSNIVPVNVKYSNTDTLAICLDIKLHVKGGEEENYTCEPFIENKKLLTVNIERGSYQLYLNTPFENFYFKIWETRSFFNSTKPYPDPLNTELISINLNKGNHIKIDINLNDSLYYYRIFNDEELPIVGNYILFDDHQEGTENKLYIERY